MAGSSIVISDQVLRADINAIRDVKATVHVNFDATHPASQKAPHFDVGVFINQNELKLLCHQASKTFSKFKFGTQEVTKQIPNQIKFEVMKFSQDMIPSDKRQKIEHAIQELKAGINGGFIQNIF